jgi:drug/metabolite transporter (DMT)-like permease
MVFRMAAFFQAHVGEFCALGTALLWTLCTLAWTSAGKRVGATAVCFNRLVIATLMLMIYGKIFHGAWLPLDASPRVWAILLVSGFLGFFLADLAIVKSFLIIGPRLALLLQSLTPPAVVLIAKLRLGETFGFMNWIGMAITLSGVVWVVLERPESPKEMHHRKDFAWGIFLAALAALLGAVSQVLSKEAIGDVGDGGFDPFAITLMRILGGIACFPLLLTINGSWRHIGKAAINFRVMSIIFLGTISGPFFGVALNMKALGLCSTGVVATLINTTPVIVLPLMILIYKEKVSPRAAIGAVISVVGVAILMLSRQ